MDKKFQREELALITMAVHRYMNNILASPIAVMSLTHQLDPLSIKPGMTTIACALLKAAQWSLEDDTPDPDLTAWANAMIKADFVNDDFRKLCLNMGFKLSEEDDTEGLDGDVTRKMKADQLSVVKDLLKDWGGE